MVGDFLIISLVASVVLTVVANVALRFWRPDPDRLFPPADDKTAQNDDRRSEPVRPGPRVRVFFPWKAMLAISVGLTLAINIIALLTD